jgi:hypothetical protein
MKSSEKPIVQMTLSSFKDPEVEDWEELVITVRTNLRAEEAIKLWDELSELEDEVASMLSGEELELFNRKVSIHVDWE